jgi:16S rRNA processing protein RimM
MAITLPQPVCIGNISGAHGVHGELIVRHNLAKPQLVAKWQAIMLELLPGSFIPHFIESTRAIDDDSFIVKFEGIDTPEQAKALKQCRAFASPLITEVALKENDYQGIIGFNVSEPHQGLQAKLLRIDRIGMQQFFVLDNKGNELLVPIQEEFIMQVLPQTQQLILQLPEGYVDAFNS